MNKDYTALQKAWSTQHKWCNSLCNVNLQRDHSHKRIWVYWTEKSRQSQRVARWLEHWGKVPRRQPPLKSTWAAFEGTARELWASIPQREGTMIPLYYFTKETMLFSPLLSDIRNKTLTLIFAEKMLRNTELKAFHSQAGSQIFSFIRKMTMALLQAES